MADCVIGIDGGGGHTEARVVAPDGAMLGVGSAGPSNPRVVGAVESGQALVAAARLALEQAAVQPPVAAAACCLSGAGRPAEQAAARESLLSAGLARQVTVTHDAAATLAAAGVTGPGVAIIAGTGAFVWGRGADGAEARAGGWGSLLGDECAAFGIALAGLRAVCRAHDGSGPPTRLLDAALTYFNVVSATDLIPLLALPTIPRAEIAAFAPSVLDAAETMDAVAVDIAESAVAALARDTLAVCAKLFAADAVIPAACGGGLWQHRLWSERFGHTMAAALPGLRLARATESPAIGAARMAWAALGRPVPASITPLLEGAAASAAPAQVDSRKLFEECRGLLTEQRNPATTGIDLMSALDIVTVMNEQDRLVAPAVGAVLPQIAAAVDAIVGAFRQGGRLFYIGAGTSGRLGALDAAEIPPTFGAPPELVQAVVAGGMATLLRSREGAEDRAQDAARDLAARRFGPRDVLVGVAASRRTPYVLAGLRHARALGARTVLVTCSPSTEPMPDVDILIAPLVGPEAIMGSTRLKSGTAQKMILNMLTTAAMIRLGKVYQNMMVDLQLSCGKLAERAKRTLMMAAGLEYDAAARLLAAAGGSVKRALVMSARGCSADEADQALSKADGFVRRAMQDKIAKTESI